MAHPLTQHPSSALPFPTAVRPSSIGFGFGYTNPSNKSPFSAFRPPGGNVGTSSVFGGPSTRPTISPKRIPIQPIKGITTPTATPRLKRHRRSSSTSSTSTPSLVSTSPTASPSRQGGSLRRQPKDELSVGELAIHHSQHGVGSGSRTKRLRQDGPLRESDIPASTPELDVGVLLAALPPTAHLSIILNLMRVDPSLEKAILSYLPPPDLAECRAELGRIIERIHRSNDRSAITTSTERNWRRAQHEVDTYCRTATTYIRFFTLTPDISRKPEAQVIQSLLSTITQQVIGLLGLVPAEIITLELPDTCRSLLDLAKAILDTWNKWLSAVSEDVNQNGGMYAHSTVTAWADVFEDLSPQTVSGNLRGSWRVTFSGVPSLAPTGLTENIYTSSFRSAFVPIKDRFYAEVGWLVSKHTSQPLVKVATPTTTAW